MFTVSCERHGSEVLLPERHITGLRNTAAGIEVDWRCFCGHHGTFVTGRRRTRVTRLVPASA